ncbi:hypothetical protein CHS0354_024775 [Potamilus streckersoni]|uniref:BACK domain-containing protein n=1 Tax=Potamilus streckersoni TaxID=2493646 RepID=A0AAE0RX62_9BIVA|nr:hypothetical protein CHS0354_024775 [Potamilus streckersoni]
MVLTQEELCASEEEVYEAMKDWARNACAQRNILSSGENLRKVLGGLLNLIRFSVMDQNYFADEVAIDDKILNPRQKIIFSKNFCTVTWTQSSTQPQKTHLSTKERC